jgi:hypothetical protein
VQLHQFLWARREDCRRPHENYSCTPDVILAQQLQSLQSPTDSVCNAPRHPVPFLHRLKTRALVRPPRPMPSRSTRAGRSPPHLATGQASRVRAVRRPVPWWYARGIGTGGGPPRYTCTTGRPGAARGPLGPDRAGTLRAASGHGPHRTVPPPCPGRVLGPWHDPWAILSGHGPLGPHYIGPRPSPVPSLKNLKFSQTTISSIQHKYDK